jgi:hypothetical protein
MVLGLALSGLPKLKDKDWPSINVNGDKVLAVVSGHFRPASQLRPERLFLNGTREETQVANLNHLRVQ